MAPEVLAATRELRGRLDAETQELVRRHVVWCTDEMLVRFLIARDWHAEAAAKLLKQALRWRDRRKPDWVLSEPSSAVARRFEKEAETGKIRVTGVDRYGRAVLVLDNSVENTKDDNWHMNFVAWNTMLASRTSVPGVDKICIVLHLERFSVLNQPPLWVTRETMEMLTKGFPETLGTAILYQPPAAFMQFYNLVKYLLDPKPRSKVHFIRGDCSPGTANHEKLCYLIGDNWQELTGCGQKPLERRYSEFHGREIDCTPGFSRERYWADVLAHERAWAKAHPEKLPVSEEEAEQAGGPHRRPASSSATGQKSSLLSCFDGIITLAPPVSPRAAGAGPGPREQSGVTKGGLELPPAPPGVPPLELETHISGIATRQPMAPEVLAAARELRGCFDPETQALVRRHAVWCTDETLIRFLIARDWRAQAAAKLLKEALRWRDYRKPDWVLSNPSSTVARRFETEAETGKIRVAGRDRYGRAVMIFDNACENTKDDNWHMNFVAWNTMLASRTSAPGVDKICLLVQLDRFSVAEQPPLKVTMECMTMLTKGFPESLGTCILYQPPAAFMQLYNVIKYLVDPKPRSKFHFIKGDCSPGTANHARLCYLIGDNWQELTGCGLKPLERRYSEFHGREIDCSPGFIRERYWADVLARERAWAEAHPEALPVQEKAAEPAKIARKAADSLEKPRKMASGFCGVSVAVAVAGILVSALTVNASIVNVWLGGS